MDLRCVDNNIVIINFSTVLHKHPDNKRYNISRRMLENGLAYFQLRFHHILRIMALMRFLSFIPKFQDNPLQR